MAAPKVVRPRSIASHLALLCAAVALPILLCVSAILWRYASAEQKTLENRGLDSAREISDLLDADLFSLEAMLRTLSTAWRMKAADHHAIFESAVEVTNQTGLAVILSDARGHAIFNTRQPFGADLPDVNPAVLRAAETKQAVVTGAYISQNMNHAMYSVAVPVFRRNTDEVIHVLQFSISTQRIRDILVRSIGTQDARASVIDSRGRILTRTVNEHVAQGTTWQGFARAGHDREGVFRQNNLEGVASLTSFKRMRAADWMVVTGVDAEVVDGPMRQLLAQLISLAALTALTAGAIGMVLSRRLLASLELLEANTIRIGAGAPLRGVTTPVLEVNRIADFLSQSSKELQHANEAKEALLYEVNHRVKNSLAVVTSILSMQARQAPAAQERRALLELRSRIDIIARVHQSLYESGHHNSVNVGMFLEEVASTTVEALDSGRACRLKATCDPDVVMPVYRTTPLALIAAELITNAVKHAQTAGAPCNITLRFAREGETGLSLLIADDGVGLPANFDPMRPKGVGTRIITGLLKQLRATMTTNAGAPGATFLITLDEAHRE